MVLPEGVRGAGPGGELRGGGLLGGGPTGRPGGGPGRSGGGPGTHTGGPRRRGLRRESQKLPTRSKRRSINKSATSAPSAPPTSHPTRTMPKTTPIPMPMPKRSPRPFCKKGFFRAGLGVICVACPLAGRACGLSLCPPHTSSGKTQIHQRMLKYTAKCDHIYKCRALPSLAAKAASLRASLKVGCASGKRKMSSAEAP